MTLNFRRVNRVPQDTANLAYVAIPSAPAASIIDIVDPNGNTGVEQRRIMYGDIAGRLVDINGSPEIDTAFPVITDLFYDADNDRILDADEVIKEAALPYRYRSHRTYYGRVIYPTAPKVEKLIATHEAWSVNDSTCVITANGTTFTPDALIGQYVYPTAMTFSMGTGVTPPAVPITVRRKIVDNDATTITYEEPFFAGGDIVNTITFRRIELVDGESQLFSLVGTEDIRLVDENRRPYSGRYLLLIQRNGSQGSETSDGYCASWIHVLLDRDDQELYLEFTAATLGIDGNGDTAVVADTLDTEYRERVEPAEFFRYTSMTQVIDPANVGRDIAASVHYGDKHAIYVPDKAIIDERIIDQLMWRVRADITRSTQVKSSTRIDELKVGVIGDVPESLDAFLRYDPTYAFRMTCRNPYPLSTDGGSYWNVNLENVRWSDYDVVIYRAWNIEWSTVYAYAAAVANSGGVFLIDSMARNVVIDGGTTAEAKVPTNLKLGVTTPFPQVTGSVTSVAGPDWLFKTEGGYDITGHDLTKLIPTYTDRRPKIAVAASHESIITALSSTFFAQIHKGIFSSVIGLSSVDSDAKKQLFCNLVWGIGAADPTREISAGSLVRTFYSPWETSWVAGYNVAGEPVLSASELEQYGFKMRVVDATSEKRIVRNLSAKAASQIIGEALAASGDAEYLKGAESIVYTLELCAYDPFYVHYKAELAETDQPMAWSTRDNSPVFDVPPGYLIKSFLEETTPGAIPNGPNDIISNVQVVGTMTMLEDNEFSWSFEGGFGYTARYETIKEVPVTSGSGQIALVTTWSDINWTATNILNDNDVRSEANLYGWGSQTAIKWYPWDGQSFLASLGSTGDYVSYVQRALNALADVGRGHRTGRLAVTGKFDKKTDTAVRDYQKRWRLTVDGDVDAGTAGHIMRNAGSITDWTDLDQRWASYGDMNNIVDGNPHSVSGRRTWINAKVGRMYDEIYIYFRQSVKLCAIEIQPYMLGSGMAQYLRVSRLGGRRAGNPAVFDWAYDSSAAMNSSWHIASEEVASRRLDITNDSDMLCISLFQDNPYNSKSRQWGVRNVIPYCKVVSYETRQEHGQSGYNAAIEITSVTHDATAKTSTVKTRKPHGLNVGDAIWITGLATSGTDDASFPVIRIIDATTFVYQSEPVSSTTETPAASSVTRFVGDRIRTGEKVVRVVRPAVPQGGTFTGWELTAAQIATAITSSIVGTDQSNIEVSVEIKTNGDLVITFSSPLSSAGTEVSYGNEATVFMEHDAIFGFDKEYETGSATAGSNTTTINDTSKQWVADSLAGRTVLIKEGDYAGLTRTVRSNTASAFVVDAAFPGNIATGVDYELSDGPCLPLSIGVTASGNSSGTTLVTTGGLVADALIGRYLVFTSGVNDGRVVKITDNTTTNIVFAAPKTPLTVDGNNYIAVNNNTAKVISGHWPLFDDAEEDEAYSILYRVEVISSTGSVMGVFIITDEKGAIVEVLKQITYNEIIKYGLDNVHIGVTNLHLMADPTIGFMEPFPVRYAMKPFCIVEKVSGCDIDVVGLSGDQPNEIWGLLVETGTIRKEIVIPSGLVNTDDDAQLAMAQVMAGSIAECVYRIEGGGYSSTYGEPYVDVVGETCENLTYAGGYGSVRVLMTPIKLDDDFIPIVSLKLDGVADLMTVVDADLETGTIFFHTDSVFNPERPAVTADYTYRERYIRYVGDATEVLDLCPYDGHKISIGGSVKDVSTMVGVPIYVYALPNLVRVGGTSETRTRVLNHTDDGSIFDPESPFYNPFAMLLCIVTIKESGSSAEIMIVDTRTGGGGLVEGADAIFKNDQRLVHYTGFNELESFFDIGALDGDGYLKGGSVILRLPVTWRDEWLARGMDPDAMVREFCDRWLAAGKVRTAFWVDAQQNVVKRIDTSAE